MPYTGWCAIPMSNPLAKWKREDVASISLIYVDEEWDLTISSTHEPALEVDRQGPTPGPLLDWAVKWAKDRGLKVAHINTVAFRLQEIPSDEVQVQP